MKMGLLDYIGIKKYFSRAEIVDSVSESTEYVLSSEEKLRRHKSKLARELDDFPRSNSEIEYVYLEPRVMRAILRDCVRQ